MTSLAESAEVLDFQILDLSNVPEEVKGKRPSDKPPPFKRDRCSSSGRSDCDDLSLRTHLDEMKNSLDNVLKSIISRKEIEEVVKNAVREVKEEIKHKLKSEIKSEIEKDIRESVKQEYDAKIRELNDDLKQKSRVSDEKHDGLNLEIENLKGKIKKQDDEMKKVKERLRESERETMKVKVMANFNHQYSQKNNVKVLKWKENRNENLREEFCEIVRQKSGVIVNPNDILAIHGVPHGVMGKNGPRPVIIRFINSESRVAVLRQRKNLKETFTLIDHLTPMNIELLQKLQSHPKIEYAWYFNTRIFAYDCRGKKWRFDVCDDIDAKLRDVPLEDDD